MGTSAITPAPISRPGTLRVSPFFAAQRIILCLLAATAMAFAQTPADCHKARKHGQLPEARKCYSRLTGSSNPAYQAEGFWGLYDYKAANDSFRIAVGKFPQDPDLRVRWGRLYLERAQPKEAADLFSEALEIKKDHGGAQLGLALIAADHFEQKGVEFAQEALKFDPKLVEAQELLARIALEDNNSEKAVIEADKAIAMSPEALDALAIRATVDWMNDKPTSEWMDRVLKINPLYGEAYATAGHFFVINRRYKEGIQFYRKALELNPSLWDAKSELGVNLMRLGYEGEARKLLTEVYNDGLSTQPVRNTLKLLDTYEHFQTFETPRTILRLDKKEAAVLQPYFQAELDRAIATYDNKYKMKLTAPVQVEVYPNHEDFAVRTMGMPGLGALGVTFGTVVAMDSPSGRKPGEWHWASTMWHELSHVYVLTATNHKVPRWFTEGLAVHEETATDPEWGDRMGAEIVKAISGKKLLPVAELDRGFVHPSYPAQVVVSYFQAGKICDYINEKYSYDTLLAMMHSFAAGKSTAEVVELQLKVKPEEFDKAFLAWLDGKVGKTVSGFTDWMKRIRNVAESIKTKKFDDAITEGTAIEGLFPDYVEHSSVYEQLAEAYEAKGQPEKAREELEKYSQLGGRSPVVLKKLATLEEKAGDKKAAARTLNKLNFIYPIDEELHRRLGGLWSDLGNRAGAINEFRTLVAMNPVDTAGANFALAQSYHAAGRYVDAKDAVFQALEAAPGFKPAQKLLLELDRETAQAPQVAPAPAPPAVKKQ